MLNLRKNREFNGDNGMAKDVRLQLMIEKELLKKIDDYRYENRIPSRSAAIRKLLEIALKKVKKKPAK